MQNLPCSDLERSLECYIVTVLHFIHEVKLECQSLLRDHIPCKNVCFTIILSFLIQNKCFSSNAICPIWLRTGKHLKTPLLLLFKKSNNMFCKCFLFLKLEMNHHNIWGPISPFFSPSFLFLLEPNQHSSLLPLTASARGPAAGAGGVLVVELTCVLFTRQMSWAGLSSASRVCLTRSSVMQRSACLPLPKHCPGFRPMLLFLKELRLGAQNGCQYDGTGC